MIYTHCTCMLTIDTLLQCPIDPVKVSQLLFSKKCISEATLDKIEMLSSLDEKKTTLLHLLNQMRITIIIIILSFSSSSKYIVYSIQVLIMNVKKLFHSIQMFLKVCD